MACVKEIRDYLDGRVPFSTKLDFDNVGLLAGEPDREVRRVLQNVFVDLSFCIYFGIVLNILSPQHSRKP